MLKTSRKIIPLEEGKTYPFHIAGEIILPNGIVCYKLTDHNGINHLLNKDHYTGYNLKPGSWIECRIDKINCTGQIFIEPLHPVYRQGECYDLILAETRETVNSEGQQQTRAILLDALYNETDLPSDDLPENAEPGDVISCKVDRIRYGILSVRPCFYDQNLFKLQSGKLYQFSLTGTKTYGKGREYYILEDRGRNKYALRKKFYKRYGFSTGDTIQCEVKRSGNEKHLEPLHPVFKKGIKYEFEILGEDVITKYPDIRTPVYTLKNPYGKTIVIEKAKIAAKNIRNNKVRCIILDIIKSMPVIGCK